MAGFDGLNPEFLNSLQAMINASGGKIYLVSGYRSEERQQQLWDAAVAKYGSPEAARKWVAPPGSSNHNFGLAADLGGDLSLAHQLAPQFGLSFRMQWEPWHIEPINVAKLRGSDPKDAYTTPPDGVTAQDPRKDTGHQLWALAQILTGKDPAEVDATIMNTTDVQPQAKGAVTGGVGAAATGGDLQSRFLAAIRQHESGGNYQAKNPNGSASGAYQFIDQTWNNFGGYKHAADAPQEVQDQKALQYLGQIMGASQDPRVWAAYWFYPAEAMKLAQGQGDWNFAPAPDVNNGLTLGAYADSIQKLMGGS